MQTFLFVCLGIGLSYSLDPCIQFKILPQMENRVTNYIADTLNGETEICDQYHIPTAGDWYKSTKTMPTTAPNPLTCGTTFPIWMNGEHPSEADGIVTRKACRVSVTGGNCAHEYEIKVKKCNDYWTYFLLSPQFCPEAYCFGSGVLDTPPTFQAPKPLVKPSLRTAVNANNFPYDTLIFQCEFDMSQTEDLFYQVSWYVDGKFLTSSVSKKSSDPFLSALTEDHIQLGKWIDCKVRAKYREDGTLGPMSKSDGFYAGVKVPGQVLNIIRGETTNVPIQFTVPFGCHGDKNDPGRNCFITVVMALPHNTAGRECSAELGVVENIKPGHIGDSSNCRQNIDKNGWNKIHNLTISVLDPGEYTPKSSFILNLALKSPQHMIWNDYRLDDIVVNVKDFDKQGWKGAICTARNDPHMITFDGRCYDTHAPGKYILYENSDNRFDIQVQMQLYPCWSGRIYCICGAAVRAGADVYRIDLCNNKNKKMKNDIGFVSCADNLLIVKRRRHDASKYVIFLPTGTEVEIDIESLAHLSSQGRIRIMIRSSLHDWEKTSGLCGSLNNNCKDDLLYRDSTTSEPHSNCENSCRYDHKNAYSKSWKVDVARDIDLFDVEKNDKIDPWTDKIRYCACSRPGIAHGNFDCFASSMLSCALDDDFQETGGDCSEKYWEEGLTVLRRRTKRKAMEATTVPKQVNMTLEQARTYCKEYMEKSEAFNLCSNIKSQMNDDTIEMCAVDISLTGATEWMEPALDSVKSSCFAELRRNNTYSSDDDSSNLASQIMEVLCPGVPVCSNNGVCINATCKCNDTFMAPDCSVKITDPPEIIGILGNGYCDKSKSSCLKSFLMGDEIYETPNLSCKLASFQISDKGSVTTNIATSIKAAHLETLVEVHCQLPSVRKKRSTSSNNTQPYFVEGFDISAGFCYIDQNCMPNGQGHRSNKCFICDPDESKFGWTFNEFAKECQTTKTKLDSSTGLQLWIMGAILPFVLVPVIIVVACMVYKKSTRKRKTVGDSQVFDAMPSNGLKYAHNKF